MGLMSERYGNEWMKKNVAMGTDCASDSDVDAAYDDDYDDDNKFHAQDLSALQNKAYKLMNLM